MKRRDVRAWWALPDDESFSDEQRAEKLAALEVTEGFGNDINDLVACVGQAAMREGVSFDESLNRYFILYVEWGCDSTSK